MVDQFLRFLKKTYNIPGKRVEIESVLRDYEVDLTKLSDNGSSLLNLLIMEEALDSLKMVLKPP